MAGAGLRTKVEELGGKLHFEQHRCHRVSGCLVLRLHSALSRMPLLKIAVLALPYVNLRDGRMVIVAGRPASDVCPFVSTGIRREAVTIYSSFLSLPRSRFHLFMLHEIGGVLLKPRGKISLSVSWFAPVHLLHWTDGTVTMSSVYGRQKNIRSGGTYFE